MRGRQGFQPSNARPRRRPETVERAVDVAVNVVVADAKDAVAQCAQIRRSSWMGFPLWLPLTLALSPFAPKWRDGKSGSGGVEHNSHARG